MAGDRKNYVIGFLFGVVIVLAFFVLSGATVNQSEIGRYQVDTVAFDGRSLVWQTIVDTKTGEIISGSKGVSQYRWGRWNPIESDFSKD